MLSTCQIANMADVAIARREARRRKILENSQNRLQFISGKNDSETCKESPIVSSKPVETTENLIHKESSSISNCFFNNGTINAGEEPFSFLSTNHESFATGDGDVTTSNYDLAPFISSNPPTAIPEPTQVSTPLLENIANYKYDVVLVSLIIQMLYCFSLVTFESTYFFLPLVLYVITKNFWFPKQHNSNITNILLLLNGISASRVQKIMSVTQYLSAFSQDVCVFLFTTVCIQSLWQTIRDRFE